MIRKLLLGISTAGCLGIIVLGAASFRRVTFLRYNASTTAWWIFLIHGRVQVEHFAITAGSRAYPPGWRNLTTVYTQANVHWHASYSQASASRTPRPAGSGSLSVPLWPLAALFAIGPFQHFVWRVWRRRRRRRLGLCIACGYNLTGNISGRCPECNTPVPARIQPGVTENAFPRSWNGNTG